MRPHLHVATLLAAVALVPAAHADTTDFTITGTNTSTNSPYTISFALDPSTVTAGYGYSFNVTASVDSVPDPVNVLFENDNGTRYLYVQETDGDNYFESDIFQPNGATPFFSGDGSSGTVPTFNDGTYLGSNYISCENDTSVHMPNALFPTAALLQIPVITAGCGDPVSLTESTPSTTPPTSPTVTPEPSTLALLGTGALTTVGILRRRFSL